MMYIIGIIGGVLAFIAAFFFKSKTSNEAIEARQEATKEKLAEADKTLAGNREDLKAESTLREELANNAKKEENEKVTSDNIVDFFNNRK